MRFAYMFYINILSNARLTSNAYRSHRSNIFVAIFDAIQLSEGKVTSVLHGAIPLHRKDLYQENCTAGKSSVRDNFKISYLYIYSGIRLFFAIQTSQISLHTPCTSINHSDFAQVRHKAFNAVATPFINDQFQQMQIVCLE